MKTLVAISAAVVLLFVLVCPLSPTPIAVVNGNAHPHQAQATAPALIVLATTFTPILLFSFDVLESADQAVSARVVDLTCVRLC